MRRPSRLGLAVVLSLLFVVSAYTVGWFFVAGRIEQGVAQWVEDMRVQDLDVSWRDRRVSGYPLAFRIELSEARLHRSAGAGGELRAPLLAASARPWRLRTWQLSAPDGISGTTGPAASPLATLTARTADGRVAVFGEGAADISLSLGEPVLVAGSADSGTRLAARTAALTLTLPPKEPQTHREPAVVSVLQLQDVTLPAVPSPLRSSVDYIEVGITLKGTIPPGSAREAAQAWRDAGGTLELDGLHVHWGTLKLTAAGTAALDTDMQPMGAFSGTIEGADELLTALGAAGRLRPRDAQLAKMALSMLARPGPDGRSRVATSFTIQNGEMSLGPVKLGKAPRIAWE